MQGNKTHQQTVSITNREVNTRNGGDEVEAIPAEAVGEHRDNIPPIGSDDRSGPRGVNQESRHAKHGS